MIPVLYHCFRGYARKSEREAMRLFDTLFLQAISNSTKKNGHDQYIIKKMEKYGYNFYNKPVKDDLKSKKTGETLLNARE